jgi:hypothetical protein
MSIPHDLDIDHKISALQTLQPLQFLADTFEKQGIRILTMRVTYKYGGRKKWE